MVSNLYLYQELLTVSISHHPQVHDTFLCAPITHAPSVLELAFTQILQVNGIEFRYVVKLLFIRLALPLKYAVPSTSVTFVFVNEMLLLEWSSKSVLNGIYKIVFTHGCHLLVELLYTLLNIVILSKQKK